MKRDKHASEARNDGVHWTVSELNYLEAHYQTAPLVDIATHLGRTASAIMAMAGKLGLSRTDNDWSDDELQCLHQQASALCGAYRGNLMRPSASRRVI
ncbi:hypothetical protein WH357_18725 [Enterobacter ludwigii]